MIFETYTNRDISNKSTLRKNYYNDVYTDTLNKIKENIKENKIWVSINEITDVDERYVTNYVNGTLKMTN